MSHHLSPCAVVQSHRDTVCNRRIRLPDADGEKLSQEQAQRILDYCQGVRHSRYQSILVTTLLLLSLSLGDDDAFRVMPSHDEDIHRKDLQLFMVRLHDFPPCSKRALMEHAHLHQFMNGDGDSPAPTSILPLVQLQSRRFPYPALVAATQYDHYRQRIYELTYTEITHVLTVCGELFPQSEEEMDMCITVGMNQAQRQPPTYPYLLDRHVDQYDYAQVAVYEIYDLLPYSTYDAKRVYRASQDLTPFSLRGLAYSSAWSLAYVEYALSQWSLDEALNRIVRAANLRAPLSCHQFLALCHEYESIQHVSDAQIRDLLTIPQPTMLYDAFGVAVYPGDMVALAERLSDPELRLNVVVTVYPNRTLCSDNLDLMIPGVSRFRGKPIPGKRVVKLTWDQLADTRR